MVFDGSGVSVPADAWIRWHTHPKPAELGRTKRVRVGAAIGCGAAAGGVPVLVHNDNEVCPTSITVSWGPGMPKSQFKLKADALKQLGDEGKLVKAPNSLPARAGIEKGYKQDFFKRVYAQFNDKNPEFVAATCRRIFGDMNPDHVWELQLGGPDIRSNLHMLDATTSQAIGGQIRQQVMHLPDYSPISVNIQGPNDYR
ncbi:hypothetical protein ACIODT_25580 [Streptomyces sp. NPDC088251]|uniref:hypothetical protein n=1 Tax=unclassified Streptomyces TaxID=2593676 RepID=UPI00381E1A66